MAEISSKCLLGEQKSGNILLHFLCCFLPHEFSSVINYISGEEITLAAAKKLVLMWLVRNHTPWNEQRGKLPSVNGKKGWSRVWQSR